MILAIRSDSPEAIIVLLAKTGQELDRVEWTAGRKLSAELLPKIEQLLAKNSSSWDAVTGVVAFEGPGSFTGLRIGATVANTTGYSLDVPVVPGAGDDWVADGLAKLAAAKPGSIVIPDYGAEPNISRPKN